MTKKCPECGEMVPDAAHFCANCGYDFFDSQSSAGNARGGGFFSDGKIFLVLIAIVIIVGAGVFVSMGLGGHNDTATDNVAKHEVDLTISDVSGWDSDSGKKSYTLYTEAIFNKVPSDLKLYTIKTTYFDENDTEIGHETEKLSNVYYDTDYALSFAYYTTYQKPNPDHVNIEIIKEGKVIDNFTSKVDKNSIDFLN